MCSRRRHVTWTWFALVCLAGCRSTQELGVTSNAPPADSTSRSNSVPTPDPQRRGELELQAARCISYRRQRAAEGLAGTHTPNGKARAHTQEDAPPADDTALVAPSPELAQGPILGAVAADGVKIWVRSTGPGAWRVRAWQKDDEDEAPNAEVEGPLLTAANDFTASLTIGGLRPRHRYRYEVMLRAPGSASDEAPVASGEFRTLARDGEPTRTRLVVGADISGSGPQRIFEQMSGVNPDFVLFLGDQVYADEADPTRDGYAEYYRHNWNIKYLRPMLRHVPAFMIWDDHEIEDNYWEGKSERYFPARAAYELYVNEHNPAPFRSDALYYTLRSGDVSLFVLDVRSHRSSNKLRDDEHKTMLGAQQKQDLIDWLACEAAKLKVIVSPVIWSDWSTTRDDAWSAFSTEREELLGFIANAQIGPVLFLSGDQHWSAVFRFVRDDYVFYEFLPTPLSKSRGRVPAVWTDEIVARDDDNFVFGVVDVDTTVDPIDLALTLCAEHKPCRPGEEPSPGTGLDVEGPSENVPFTLHLTGRDLGTQW